MSADLQAEQAALARAAVRFAEWRRDWHDHGARVDHKALAELRKAARAFHKALHPILEAGTATGTRARLLARMQEHHLFRRSQSDYRDDLVAAMAAALVIDGACAREVRAGVKADPLTTSWVWMAADEWEGAGFRASAAERARFLHALAAFRDRRVPAAPGADGVRAVLRQRKAARASVGG